MRACRQGCRETMDIITDIYMLGTTDGFAQSTDCAAQTMDPYFARQSINFVRNPWIARI